MIVVIADDITGAAEIAGIARSRGCRVSLSTSIDIFKSSEVDDLDVCVIATDSRSLLPNKAAKSMSEIAGQLSERKDVTIFKKTDSVLRGHIVTELESLKSALGIEKVMLLPQNPSKGRIIKNGVYYINGVPLSDTPFSYDPEFPMNTSGVEEILPEINYVSVDAALSMRGISLCEASTLEDVDIQLSKSDEDTLIAGAADLFSIWIGRIFPKASPISSSSVLPNKGKALVFCGSTQSHSLIDEPYFASFRSTEQNMPLEVFHGDSPEMWFERLSDLYENNDCLIIKVGHPSQGGQDFALRIKHLFAIVAKRLIEQHQPNLLIIEGGATAFAIIQELGWHNLMVKREIDPGVVSLNYGATEVILKPGSYPWGALFDGVI